MALTTAVETRAGEIRSLEERVAHLQKERDDAFAERDKAREKAKTAGKLIAALKKQVDGIDEEYVHAGDVGNMVDVHKREVAALRQELAFEADSFRAAWFQVRGGSADPNDEPPRDRSTIVGSIGHLRLLLDAAEPLRLWAVRQVAQHPNASDAHEILTSGEAVVRLGDLRRWVA